MNTRECKPNWITIGIPLAVELHEDHCSIAVDALITFLRDVTQAQRALRDMGVVLSDARSIQGDAQLFGLARSGKLGGTTTSGDRAINDDPKRATTSAVNVVRACLKSAGAMTTSASSSAQDTEPEPPSTTGAHAIDGLDVELIRRRVAGGPSYVLLDGKITPWSTNIPKPARGNPHPKPPPVAIELVGNEVHLITSANRRYHPEESADVSAVESGSRVTVEACTTERVLFAGSDALVLQGELDFPGDQSGS